MFESLKAMPSDAILRLIAEHENDPRAEKIDLGVGVYRDANGVTPVLSSVKKAEQQIVAEQATKAYLSSGGDPIFNDAIQRLLFGDDGIDSSRITTLQTPGGSGSLRVAAGLIVRAMPDVTVWASEPTWANHIPLLGGAGINLRTYRYYDAGKKSLRFDDMMADIAEIPAGDIVLLHACCHNPTGMDPQASQWREIADVMASRRLMPFIDIAYQGFAQGLAEDAYAVRLMAERVPEMIVSASCSKNFGLYRDRVGSLSIVGRDADTSAILKSQTYNIVRTMYSMPPDHGSAVVSRILVDDRLRSEWMDELAGMRNRLTQMRTLLAAALRRTAPDHDFSHIERANGMFLFVGIDEDQVNRLKSDYGVYMVASSRVNIAGITADNVDYLAESIAAVL